MFSRLGVASSSVETVFKNAGKSVQSVFERAVQSGENLNGISFSYDPPADRTAQSDLSLWIG